MKVAFIDLDHTVMINPFWPRVFPHIGEELAAEADGMTPEDVIALLTAKSLELHERGELRSHDWDALTVELARELNATWNESVSELVERYAKHASLVPGAMDALTDIRSEGWSLVAASQGFRRYQEPIVRALGLWRLFDRMIFSDDAGTLKRDRRFYGRIPACANRVAVVGDLYLDDVLYPARFGFVTIWFTGVRSKASDHRYLCDVEPDFEIQTLQELPGALRRIATEVRFAFQAPPLDAPTCPRCGGPLGDTEGLCSTCECVLGAARDVSDISE